jgi:glycosyltransferase involved in cell wall biosynthesis
MADLTVIIGMKNEADQLKETLKSIRATQDADVNIIVIDDASTDKYPYTQVCSTYNAKIIRNRVNQGVGASRDLGIKEATTRHILMIDGHMRFRRDNWVTKISKYLDEHPKSVMCAGCGFLNKKRLTEDLNTQDKIDEKLHTWGWRGAGIGLNTKLAAGWTGNKYWRDKNTGAYQIPTVMGASYAITVDWYNEIGGLGLLTAWGLDEQFLSWKSWRMGGDARVMTDVWIGHIWKTRPNTVKFDNAKMIRNKYVTAMITLPEPFKTKMVSIIEKSDRQLKGRKELANVIRDVKIQAAKVEAADPTNENFQRLFDCSIEVTGKNPDPDNLLDVIKPPKPLAMGLSVVLVVKDSYPNNLQELRDKAGAPIEIVVVNDSGPKDYDDMARQDNCKYHYHFETKGYARSVIDGAAQATGAVLCILPSDFRIIKDGWALDVYDQCIKTPRGLYGIVNTVDRQTLYRPNRFYTSNLECRTYTSDDKAIVPAIASGGFAISRTYFKKLDRFNLLKGFSATGLNLSIKVWLEGGFVKVFDIPLFESPKPKRENSITKLYDKVVTALTLIPESELEEALTPLIGTSGFEEAMGMVDINSEAIDATRIRLAGIMSRPYKTLKEANNIIRGLYEKR